MAPPDSSLGRPDPDGGRPGHVAFKWGIISATFPRFLRLPEKAKKRFLPAVFSYHVERVNVKEPFHTNGLWRPALVSPWSRAEHARSVCSRLRLGAGHLG